ncbi:hypothetical protein SD71_02790 [Cohnella kolymensis]|uniref:Uncharacterized protein n=1 Tax=Cohnella kolymensis TaxID=1590652 RepID=A0ABR5A943_9BACL|nr:hypothetical protein [Cohnella kolymensis]KIL37560.1 hypothetical protein SD71_02790 [Cohnella kolymensis]
MAQNRKLLIDRDFQEAMEHHIPLRVFKDDQIVDSGGIIIRFDDQIVVAQSGVSELAYHSRTECEFFEMRKR